VKSHFLSAAAALWAAGLIGAALFPLPAMAHLGGDAGSIDADQNQLHAAARSIPMQQFDLHEITTPAGTLVHEYLTRQGAVFAVTWKGPMPPDLHQLFGGYYARFQAAAAAHVRPGMHRQVTINTADLVVQSSARPRSFGGVAYVPSLLPSGVSAADLQ
jgi:Protein of unknown function (DUF2844)